MNNENSTTMNDVTNPHDKLFRETWSNLENARSFLRHYLPDHVLRLLDLDTLEISKDSFVEKELSDYYSDMLYKVMLSGKPGFVHVLFEHKSYYDNNGVLSNSTFKNPHALSGTTKHETLANR